MTATTRSTMDALADGPASARAARAAKAQATQTLLRKSTPERINLTLAVLEALASAGLTVLLTLFLSSVPREKARAFHGAPCFRIQSNKGTGDAVAHGFGLRALASARARRPNVELILRLDELKCLAKDHLRGLPLEVLLDGDAVHDDGAASGLEPNARDRRFALAGGVCAGA